MCSLVPQCLHWPFCPGVFIAILALMAAAVTFLKEPSPREKVCWLIVFSLLMIGEIWMMSKDKDKQITAENIRNAAHLAELKSQQSQFEQTLGALLGLKRQGEEIAVKLSLAKKTAGSKPSLKVDTLQVSKDILAFLADHQKTQPSFPIFSSQATQQHDREVWGARLDQWIKETSTSYTRDIQPRVIDVLARLKNRGLDTTATDQFCNMSTNPAMLGVCAENLAALAAQVN